MAMTAEYRGVVAGGEQANQQSNPLEAVDSDTILAEAHRIRDELLARGWAYLDPEEEFAQGFLAGWRTAVAFHAEWQA